MRLMFGDCLEVMPTLDENSVDTIITDPPYGLEFMGKDWDKGVPGERFWVEALRVAKPGATLLAMGGTRTFHRLVCAIEDAGWEIRDTIDYLHDGIPIIHPFAWVYGSGFPKSYDIGKGMDKAQGAERERLRLSPNARFVKRKDTSAFERPCDTDKDADMKFITAPATPEAQQWDGWGTALKPAMELICVAYNPREGTYVENALKWGVAGLWIDGGRVGIDDNDHKGKGGGGVHARHINGEINNDIYNDGWQRNGVNHSQGRFPANVIHDGSDEVVRGFPESETHSGKGVYGSAPIENTYNGGWNKRTVNQQSSSGSAARFFYCAKASRSERNAGLEGMEASIPPKLAMKNDPEYLSSDGSRRSGFRNATQNHHPTVKPLALMEYLVRLTATPTGGVVLDPFMGSGTTGIACVNEGREFIGIEMSDEYLEIARRRIEYAEQNKQPEQPVLFGNNGHKKVTA